MSQGVLRRTNLMVTVAVVLFGAVLSTCTTQPELPFEEKLVIRGLLEAGQPLSDIQISKTIPPLEEFSYEKVFVGDARAQITVVDSISYALQLQPSSSTVATVPQRSLYYVPHVRVEAGKTYKINVQWKNLIAFAETRVPLPPLVDSAHVRISIVPQRTTLGTIVIDTVFESVAWIRARAHEVYRVGTTLHDAASGRLLSARGFGEAVLARSAESIVVTSNTWRSPSVAFSVLANRIQSRVNIQVYDGAFYRYYQTRNRSGQIGIFSPGGPNIEWNVQGNGIGEFAGVATLQRAAIPRLR
ncbi:MAG: DUF4249 family protein [Bacteroidota bacterium]|nr:DUF4249 domain-containing protein [Candidatus Kapabacteria bacterium]MDW8219024.1 DUF4249 family protein [Bacteroidota bacterium]